MAMQPLISEPVLQPLLKASQLALRQTHAILDWLESNASTASDHAKLRSQLAQQQKLLHAYLIKLRGLQRRSALDVRSTKQQTAEARQEVDRLLLQLQNLYYEEKHLMGEISACEGYDHSYMRLPLISHDEYVTMFPEQAGLPEDEIMPQRIQHEKGEREQMEEERSRLHKIKEELLKENTRKKEELRKMDEKLEGMVDGLRPIEEALAQGL
jgi:hypothetical protein